MSEKIDEEITRKKQEYVVIKLSNRVNKIIKFVIALNEYKKAVFDILDASYKYEHFDNTDDFTNFKYELETLPYCRFLETLNFNHKFLPSNISKLLLETRVEIFNTIGIPNYPISDHEKIYRNIDKFVFQTLVKFYDVIFPNNMEIYEDVEIADLFNVEEEHVPFTFKEVCGPDSSTCEYNDKELLNGDYYMSVCAPKKYLLYNEYLLLIREFYRSAKVIYEKARYVEKYSSSAISMVFGSIVRVSNVIEFTVNHYDLVNEDVVGFINSELNRCVCSNAERFKKVINTLSSYYESFLSCKRKSPINFRSWYTYEKILEIEDDNGRVDIEIMKGEIADSCLYKLVFENTDCWEDPQIRATRDNNTPTVKICDMLVDKIKAANKKKMDKIIEVKKGYQKRIETILHGNIIKIENCIDKIENANHDIKLMTKPFIKHIDEYIKEQMDRLNCNDTREFMKEISGYVSESELARIDQLMIQNVRTLERLQNIVMEIKENAKDEETKKEQSTGSA